MATTWLTDVLADPRPEALLFLSRAEVVSCLNEVDVVATVRDALISHAEGRTILPSEAYLSWENDHGAYSRSIGMPGAVLPADTPGLYGMKIINASVSNPDFGLERAGGLGLCFDPDTARVRAVMEVGVLSAVRTAAVTALSVEAVGFGDARSLAMVGCGTQARVHLALLLSRCATLRVVTLHDVRAEVAEDLARSLAHRHPQVTFSVTSRPREAMAEADIAVFLTTATEGYVPPDWVRQGSLLVNASLGDLTDEVLLGAQSLVVDDVTLIEENPRRPLGRLLNAGQISPTPTASGPSITTTIGRLLARKETLPRPDRGHTVVNPFGLGVLDVALFDAVYTQAQSAGLGQNLQLY